MNGKGSVVSTVSSAAEAATPPMGTRRRWTALAVLSAALTVIAVDMTVLNVALPHIAADLAPSGTQQLWIIDAYSLILAGLLVPMSALADRFGRKRMLLTGFALFGAVSLGVLLVDGPAALIGLRALLGVAGAMIMPTTLSMIRVIFTDPRERATALGVWAAVSAVGMALGPVVGGVLLEHVSWHAAFLINVPLMVIALVGGALLLPEYRSPNPPPWDAPATLASITGTVALVWSIKRFAEAGFGDATAWGGLALAVTALGWFGWRCLRSPRPILDLRLFRHAPFTGGILAALAAMFAMGALLLLVAQWLQLVEGRSPLQAGVALLPAAVAMAVVSPLAPALAQRIGARAVLAGGLAVAGLGFLILFLAPAPLSYPWVAVALALLGGGGSSLAVGSAVIMAGTPPEKAGNAAALEETSYELGSVLGVAVLGSVAAAVYGARLDASAVAGLDAGQAHLARESLSGATEVVHVTGSAELATAASAAFVDSLTRTGLIGCLIMLAAAAVAAVLVPRRLDLATGGH